MVEPNVYFVINANTVQSNKKGKIMDFLFFYAGMNASGSPKAKKLSLTDFYHMYFKADAKSSEEQAKPRSNSPRELSSKAF